MKQFANIIHICFLLCPINSNGQVLISLLLDDELNTENIEFGLEGGFNWATITNMETGKSLRIFNLGFTSIEN
jgi:hypothetical protein